MYEHLTSRSSKICIEQNKACLLCCVENKRVHAIANGRNVMRNSFDQIIMKKMQVETSKIERERHYDGNVKCNQE